MEPPFDELPGVISTTSGYTGGRTKNPTYEEVSAGSTGHAEAVEVVFDPAKVTYAQLLDVFWKNIDPITPDRQFCDSGSQYRSAIYYHSRRAEAAGRSVEESDRRLRPVQAADRHRDCACRAVLPRRGISPGLLQEESDSLQVLQVRLRAREAPRAAVGEVMPDAVGRRVTRRRALGQRWWHRGADRERRAAAAHGRRSAARAARATGQRPGIRGAGEARAGAAAYAAIAGGDRSAFERITLRPRMMVPVLDLNLGVTLFGQAMFAPILVAPIARQGEFHADGERATVAGASAAKAVTVVSSQSSVPLASLAAAGTVPLWYQVFAQDPSAGARIQEAVTAGCRAICITIGAPLRSAKGARPLASTAQGRPGGARRADAQRQRAGSRERDHDARGGETGAAASRAGPDRLELQRERRAGGRRLDPVAAGDCRCGRRARAGPRRRQLPARHRHHQGARRSARRRCWSGGR